MHDKYRELEQQGVRVKLHSNAVRTYDPRTGWEWLKYDCGLGNGARHRAPIDFPNEGIEYREDPFGVDVEAVSDAMSERDGWWARLLRRFGP